MSRIGSAPVSIPQGVDVSVGVPLVRVNGPKGQLEVLFDESKLSVAVADGEVRVTRRSDEKAARAVHGLIRSLISNAVTGVTSGFAKRLEIHGVGYRADVQGRRLTLHLGFSHPVVYEAPDGIDLTTEDTAPGSAAQTNIVIQGIDKQRVGQVAAEIRQKRKPDPYKGKGVRYQDEVIYFKAGKTAVG